MTFFQTKEALEFNGSVSENLSILSSGHNLAWMCIVAVSVWEIGTLCYIAG